MWSCTAQSSRSRSRWPVRLSLAFSAPVRYGCDMLLRTEPSGCLQVDQRHPSTAAPSSSSLTRRSAIRLYDWAGCCSSWDNIWVSSTSKPVHVGCHHLKITWIPVNTLLIFKTYSKSMQRSPCLSQKEKRQYPWNIHEREILQRRWGKLKGLTSLKGKRIRLYK